MGEIRDAMIRDMRLRNLMPRTQDSYLRSATKVVSHFMKPPTELGGEEIKEFLQSLQDRGSSPSTLCVYRAGLQFLYGVTLLRPEVTCLFLTRRFARTDRGF